MCEMVQFVKVFLFHIYKNPYGQCLKKHVEVVQLHLDMVSKKFYNFSVINVAISTQRITILAFVK